MVVLAGDWVGIAGDRFALTIRERRRPPARYAQAMKHTDVTFPRPVAPIAIVANAMPTISQP
jgi:hypothetical protein